MSARPRIPTEVAREIFYEAGRRCAVCGLEIPLEQAHIVPCHESGNHSPENLICLCANCHERADFEWDEKALRQYKKTPWVLRQKKRVWNPFTYRGRIDNPEHIFGRDAELDNAFSLAAHGTNVRIGGPPRIGKSSVVSLVHNKLRQQVPQVSGRVSLSVVGFIDIDVMVDDDAVLARISDIYDRELSSFSQVAGYVETIDGDIETYLCIDEYQELLEARFSHFVPRFMRSLSQHAGFNMIVAIDEYKLGTFSGDPRLPYCLNLFDRMILSNLEADHVKTLVETMLRESVTKFGNAHIEDICELTECHPFKVQLACYHLYNELAGRAGGGWKEHYAEEIESNLTLHRPWNVVDEIIRVLSLTLRKSFGSNRPDREKAVSDKIDIILRSAGFDIDRESPQFRFSVKGYRPDFSVPCESLAIEVKLCNAEGKLNRIVEEMNADVSGYSKKFWHRLFVIYDSGGFIDDIPQLVDDFERMEGVRVLVCKH